VADATRQVVEYVEHIEYTLTLTDEEAQVLMDIFGRVGGDPDTTRRGLVDGISRALRDAGADYLRQITDISPKDSIYFVDEWSD
jgi:hypothetical protein